MNYLQPERLDALARAYALGTLSPRAERRFARTLATSAAAAQAVARWREILGTLELGAPATMAPRAEVWSNVQARLFERSDAQATHLPARPKRAAPGRSLAGWFGWPAAFGLATGLLVCAALVQWRPQALDLEHATGQAPASYVGVLLDDKGRPLLSTIARRHGRVLTVRLLRPVTVAPGESLTVWAWSDADPAPRRVGSWSTAGTPGTSEIALPVDAEALLSKMNHLGLSREQAAAAPATPAAPLLAQGACAKVW